MVGKKPRVVIVGAGLAGLTVAHRLHTAAPGMFDLCVFEAGDRIGGRIFTSDFAGNRVEMGATWIHGIDGSPVYDIAGRIGALDSDGKPWERMDGFGLDDAVVISEGEGRVDTELCSDVALLYNSLKESVSSGKARSSGCSSVGEFLRRGLNDHLLQKDRIFDGEEDDEQKKKLKEAVFAMHENTERTYTSADDLHTLNLHTEPEYREFPGEQITIAKGYSRVVEAIAAALPSEAIKLRSKVCRIEWLRPSPESPVKLIFDDNTSTQADHVIVTVSLGILKAGLRGEKQGLTFDPVLPKTKAGAIKRLGYGLVNKLFMELASEEEEKEFPFMELAFDSSNAAEYSSVPRWMRRTASIFPIYNRARVLLSWFSGKQAIQLESLEEHEIIEGVHSTLQAFTLTDHAGGEQQQQCNGGAVGNKSRMRITRVKTSKWGSDPLFQGSYSFVAVGSTGDDLDLMATPLPSDDDDVAISEPLQVLFGGEATHRTHYSTTHGAYFSGVREADRLLQRYLKI